MKANEKLERSQDFDGQLRKVSKIKVRITLRIAVRTWIRVENIRIEIGSVRNSEKGMDCIVYGGCEDIV